MAMDNLGLIGTNEVLRKIDLTNFAHHAAYVCRGKALPAIVGYLMWQTMHPCVEQIALDGNVAKVQAFLNKGIDPSVCDSSGYTSLHYAARNGHLEVCRTLLSMKANLNATTPGGATPLHRAALKGHVDIVCLLLKYGADPSIQDTDGKTSLHKAAEGQHLSVAKILLEVNNSLKENCDKRGLLPKNYVDSKNISLLNLLS